MENTYWNNQGKHQSTYDRLLEQMPAQGASSTVAGEMIRAVSRLGYDFYNNGMGNNTSGAVNYLDKMGVFDYDRTNIFGKIYDHSRGRIYTGSYDGDDLHLAIESAIDLTMQMIEEHPELETTTNRDDMLDYGDPDEVFYDEDEDEEYAY